mmetsp:Transcript_2397/g.7170  ORF Transcript_2397/g.7170 Transcript_2397/m.7170 type:complete len:168 (+) Transcript_2397:78-581(+)
MGAAFCASTAVWPSRLRRKTLPGVWRDDQVTVARGKVRLLASSSAQADQKIGNEEDSPVGDLDFMCSEKLDFEPDTAARVQTLLEDVKQRPTYYGSAGAALVGFYVAWSAIRSVLAVINTIPLLGDFFEVIGLAYVFWFCWEYMRDVDKRAEFLARVDDFVKSVKSA